MKGGYTIIDCKGADIEVSTAQTVKGFGVAAQEALKSGVMIILSNLKRSGVTIPDVPVYTYFDDPNICFCFDIYEISADTEDVDTFSCAKSN